MNELQVFKNEKFGTVRTITENGRTLFCAKDIANALGYKDTTNAIKQHCRWVVKRHLPHPQSPDKTIEMTFIPEGDIYRLAAKSQIPGADEFERWIFDEVLVSINHTGGYLGNTENMSDFELVSRALLIVQKQLEQRDETIRKIAPDAEYAQNCLLAENGIVTSSIAKDYGMSADSFNKLLKGLKIQYKRGGQWMLYAPYQAEGYMVFKTTPITHSDGRVELKVTSLWTAEGRKFLYDFLKERGILPLNERGRA
jgi:prophage antirepressor-like protein